MLDTKIFESKQFNVILTAMREGDRKAVALFYKRYYPFMTTVAYGIVKNIQDAEDVASERLLYFLNKPEQKYVEFPYSWLRTAARNAAIQVVVRRKRECFVDFSDEAELEKYKAHVSFVDSYREVEFKNDFYKILDMLEDDLEKEILTMRIKLGMNLAEIAKAAGVTLNVVKYRYYKVTKILKDFYT